MGQIDEILPVLVLGRCSIREVDHLRWSRFETIFEKPDKIPLEEMHRNGVVLHTVGYDDIADVFQCVITPIITHEWMDCGLCVIPVESLGSIL